MAVDWQGEITFTWDVTIVRGRVQLAVLRVRLGDSASSRQHVVGGLPPSLQVRAFAQAAALLGVAVADMEYADAPGHCTYRALASAHEGWTRCGPTPPDTEVGRFE